jgi:hypothetical protein
MGTLSNNSIAYARKLTVCSIIRTSQNGPFSVELSLFGARVPQLDVDLTPFTKHMKSSDSTFYSADLSAIIALALALVFDLSALLVCAWQKESYTNWGQLDVSNYCYVCYYWCKSDVVLNASL